MKRRVICVLLSMATLVGCHDFSQDSQSSTTPSDGTAPAVGASHNTAPTISGAPTPTILPGARFAFRPVANDADGQSLVFSVQNKPVWADFDRATGGLSGTPTAANIGRFTGIVISVTDGQATASLPGFAITVTSADAAPSITGAPATSVLAGVAYSFTPAASDPNGDPLRFAIENKPAWATFSTTTGQLSGTPTAAQIGTYSGISISVSDGQASATLPAFPIAVTQVGTGSATLSWVPPTENTDGTALTNLAGYRIYYGTNAADLSRKVQVAGTGVASYLIDNLSPSTWYFAVKAYTAANIESDLSSIVSKNIQ
jgi:Putative Ig domain